MREDYEGKEISGVEIIPIAALSKFYQLSLKSGARHKVFHWF